MNFKITLVVLFLCFRIVLIGQVNGHYIPGTSCQNCPSEGRAMNVMNGSSVIATSYTASACGLDFVQESVPLFRRSALSPLGAIQPATFSITGLPQCKIILKAFLYVGTVGSINSFSVILSNPNSGNASFPMVFIGSDVSPCWPAGGSFIYKADVTSAITGNGNYFISGVPTSTNFTLGSDAEGATLFIVYSDPGQVYTGSIVMADGCMVQTGGTAAMSATVSGFDVCGTPSLTTNFMVVGDLQTFSNSNISFNTSTLSPNFVQNKLADKMWNFITAPGAPALAGQTSAIYGLQNQNDCEIIVLAGMYFRNGCLTCSISPAINITALTGSFCPVSGTVIASGGSAPYTYSWTGTSQTGSVISGPAGSSYTLSVSDIFSCTNTAVVTLSAAPVPTILVSGATVCMYQPVSLSATGAQSYLWTHPTGINSSGPTLSIPSATNILPQTYTIVGTASSLCTASLTVFVTTLPLPTVSLISVPMTICKGQGATLTVSGANTYSWFPTVIATGSMAVVTPSVNSSYTVNGIGINGCSASATIAITVAKCLGVGGISPFTFEILIFPNPNAGSFIVETNVAMQLILVNALGTTVRHLMLNEKNDYRVSVSEIADGIYYLVSRNIGLSRKIVIEK